MSGDSGTGEPCKPVRNVDLVLRVVRDPHPGVITQERNVCTSLATVRREGTVRGQKAERWVLASLELAS